MADSEKPLKYLEVFDENQLSGYEKACFDAMKSIAQNMRTVTNTEDSESPVGERNYVLSLVYEMGKKQTPNEEASQDDTIRFGQSDLFVGGETYKRMRVDDDINYTCHDLGIAINNPNFEIVPDLVIHNSHNPEFGETGVGQYLVLEAKTTKRLGMYAFMRDFFKLNLYLTKLHFEKAIYLIINSSIERVDELIEEYINKKYYLFAHGQMFFYIQQDKECEPIVYRFCRR